MTTQTNIQTLTKDNFDSTIHQHAMVIVDFWAHWCGPCRAFSEVFENVSKKFQDILFAKVDIEKETELANDFNIKSIPFLMVFRGNVAVYAEAGAITEPALIDIIHQAKNLDLSNLQQAIKNQSEPQK